MSGRILDVRVVAVATDAATRHSKAGELAKVVFRVKAEPMEWDMPVYVERARYGDEDLIAVARSYLHSMLADLSEQTKAWAMAPEERKRRELPGKTGQSANRT